MAGPTTGKGISAVSELLAPTRDVSEQVKELATTKLPQIFYRAVVVEVLYDLHQLSEQKLLDIENAVSNPLFARFIPRNAIIARLVSGGQDRQGTKSIILYPFFSPHFNIPVKPGEQVWVIFETLGNSQIGYWLSRIPERDDVDDLNYTHADRRFVGDQELSTSEKAKGGSSNDTTPSFPNGGGSSGTLSLAEEDAYDRIIQESSAYKQFTPEVVPRYSKRPGDFAFQGSNNTLIVLGQDRLGSATSENETKQKAGTIDIVAGRSARIIPNESTISPQGNAPSVVLNTRQTLEVDKNPKLRKKQPAPKEGDPDFQEDLSRVYVSMRTNGDQNFNLTSLPRLNGGVNVSAINDSPFIIGKSDHVRLIARKDANTGVNGTIRIIKEGTVDEDQAVIIIQPDGTIMINGPKIIVGSGMKDQIYIGRDATEAAVLGNTLVSLLSDFLSNLEAYTTTVATSLGNLGAPIPQLTSAQAEFAPKIAQLKVDLSNVLSTVSKVK